MPAVPRTGRRPSFPAAPRSSTGSRPGAAERPVTACDRQAEPLQRSLNPIRRNRRAGPAEGGAELRSVRAPAGSVGRRADKPGGKRNLRPDEAGRRHSLRQGSLRHATAAQQTTTDAGLPESARPEQYRPCRPRFGSLLCLSALGLFEPSGPDPVETTREPISAASEWSSPAPSFMLSSLVLQPCH